MSKISARAFRPVYPTPAALITSISEDGTPNIITLGEVFNVSLGKPTIAGIAVRKATYSHGLISQSGEFAINLPTTKLIDQVDYCGCVSGRQADKFAESGLTAVSAVHIRPPLIEECPVNLECKVLSIQEVGDHDLFLGEVLEVHADERQLEEKFDRRSFAKDLLELGKPAAVGFEHHSTRRPRVEPATTGCALGRFDLARKGQGCQVAGTR